jgi:hypothetical protein
VHHICSGFGSFDPLEMQAGCLRSRENQYPENYILR